MFQLPMTIESVKPNSPAKVVAGATLGFAGGCVDVGMMIEPNG